jgi:hypothetical protein
LCARIQKKEEEEEEKTSSSLHAFSETRPALSPLSAKSADGALPSAVHS